MADLDSVKSALGSKKILIPVVIAAAGYIGWRYWQARNGTGADAGTDPTTSDFADGGTAPSVIGAVSPDNSYGSDTGSDTGDSGNDPTRFTTNAQWTAYVSTQLQSGYEYSAIVTALGNYLGSQPLSSDQQTIVRAAIAVGGYPPVGSFSIIPGGNTDLTIAPTGLKVTAVTATSVSLSWNPVAGAASYRVYRSGASTNIGTSNTGSIRIDGLQSGTSYTFHVAAFSAAGKAGPNSSTVTAKTSTVTLGKPSTPTLSSISKTSVKVATHPVSHADGYRWYVNGTAHGYSEAPSYTIQGLASKHEYTVTVAADLAHQNPGPASAGKKFKTK